MLIYLPNYIMKESELELELVSGWLVDCVMCYKSEACVPTKTSVDH